MTQSTQPNSKSGTYLNTFFFFNPFQQISLYISPTVHSKYISDPL